MSAGSQLTLFTFRGIRIGVDYSWFFVLFILIIYLSGVYRDVLSADTADSQPYVLAVVTALGFFASILLHELGHAVVAARNGIPISEITLWLFGGVAPMARDSDTPGTEFKVAVAGPIGNQVRAAAITGIAPFRGGEFESRTLDQQVAEVLGQGVRVRSVAASASGDPRQS